ncbi:MAG: 3-oxoacyl-ACP reductase FabG [Oscillospiraceae bacterium]|nr:3-oxoacyl-ACP reductase FabG [Oscillospiraceae bacterium]
MTCLIKNQKCAVITGASGGIGSASAFLLAKNGFCVAAHYHTRRDRAEKLVRDLTEAGYDAFAVRADVTDAEDVRRMFAGIEEKCGGADVLVNNAGAAQQKLFTDITQGDYDRVFDVNMRGVFNCCQAAVPYMIRKKSGRIINVSSVWGVSGASCEVHYSAAKAAVIGFTKALAKELGPSNITVNCVAPGFIDTEMNAELDSEAVARIVSETPLGRAGTPMDVAEAILFFAGGGAEFLTGQVLMVDGGFRL